MRYDDELPVRLLFDRSSGAVVVEWQGEINGEMHGCSTVLSADFAFRLRDLLAKVRDTDGTSERMRIRDRERASVLADYYHRRASLGIRP